MTTTDRRTKAQLLEELAGARAHRDAALDEADAATAKLKELDLETRVIAGCLAELQQLRRPAHDHHNHHSVIHGSRLDGSRHGGGGGGGELTPLLPDNAAVGRVLRYLAIRLGLPDPRAEVDRLQEQLDEQFERAQRLQDELRRARQAASAIVDVDPAV